jgi:hypothetical protein
MYPPSSTRSQYRSWLSLVSSVRSNVTVYVDSVGRITHPGRPVPANISRVDAQLEGFTISFAAESSERLQSLRVFWHEDLHLPSRGVFHRKLEDSSFLSV